MRISDWSSDVCSSDLEHRLHPGAFAADQFANTLVLIAIGHDASGGCVNAKLMFYGSTANIVKRPDIAFRIYAIFGYDEERNPLCACGRVRRAGENKMNDVVRQIMFATGNEYLLPLDPVRAVAHGRRSDERRVGKECVSTCRSRGSP